MFILAVTASLLVGASACAAPASDCTEAQAKAAELATDTLRDWKAVATFYDHFLQCDDASIAEGATDALAKLLVRTRPQVDVLQKLAAARPGMEAFVVLHVVDETMALEDSRNISEQLPRRCEPTAQRLCSVLARAARRPPTSP